MLGREHRQRDEEQDDAGGRTGEEDAACTRRSSRCSGRTRSSTSAAQTIGTAASGPIGEIIDVSSPVTAAVNVAMPGVRVTTRASSGIAVCTAATSAYAGGDDTASNEVMGTTMTKISAWTAANAALMSSALVGTRLTVLGRASSISPA